MVAMFAAQATHYRFYEDDAGEAASTPLENEDVDENLDVTAGDIAFQLRIMWEETGGADGSSMDDWQITYDKNGGGETDLTTTDTGDGIRAVAAGLTNNNVTTNRGTNGLTDPGSGSFVDGEQCTDGLLDDRLLTLGDFTEHVWGIEIVSANVADSDSFVFGISSPSAATMGSQTPTITITKTGVTLQSIAAVASNVATLSTTATHFRALSVTASNVPVLGTVFTHFEALAVVASNIAVLTFARLTQQAIAAVASNIAALGTVTTHVAVLAVTTANVAVVSTVTTHLRTLAATASNVPVLTKKMFVTLAVTTSNVPVLLKKMFKTLAVVTSNVAALTPVEITVQAVAAVAANIASLGTSFTPAPPPVVEIMRNVLQSVLRPIKRFINREQ